VAGDQAGPDEGGPDGENGAGQGGLWGLCPEWMPGFLCWLYEILFN